LVYDISDGVDQLPIRQHALSRIWAAAENGQEEMDLIHYAMVGGMPVDELPDADMVRYQKWFSALPAYQSKLYAETGLNKVIEIHANQLYETACDNYNQKFPHKPLSPQDAKRIIALTFSCLTKIDNSRAVRNRMTLGEITAIINNPALTHTVVGEVLNIFREAGNAFIRPFITEDPGTRALQSDTVLDITHESLIRNWNKLNQWANKEFEYYETFLDFQKQLDRWKHSGKSNNYLLPIGPLTYFENWYTNCKPNTAWIRRYIDAGHSAEESMKEADQILENSRQFLKRSARKEAISRAFMKYGPRKVFTVLAVVIMLGLTGFYWYDAEKKRNSEVIKEVRKESAVLLMKPEVGVLEKALYLLAEERFDSGSAISLLQKLSTRERIKIGSETYKQILYIDKHRETDLKKTIMNQLFEDLEAAGKTESPDWILPENNKVLILAALDKYYNPEKQRDERISSLSKRNYTLITKFFSDTSLNRPSIATQLNIAVQLWLSSGLAKTEDVEGIARAFSAQGDATGSAVFNKYYPKGSLEVNGRASMDFNGGYHTAASVYAALGDTAALLNCYRKLLQNNQRDYFELARVLNNHSNIIGYLYQFGHREKVPGIIQWLSSNTRDNPPATLFRNTVIRGGYISHLYTINIDLNIHRSTRGYLYPNLFFMDRKAYDALLEDYEAVLKQIKDPSERNFQMAMQSKRKAMFYHKYWYDRGMKPDMGKLDAWLDEAMAYYRATDPSYLEGKQSSTLVYNGDGVRTSDVGRRTLFIYPDYRDGWFAWTYHSDYFFQYLRRKGLLTELYPTAASLQGIHFWIAKAFEWKIFLPVSSYSNNYPLPDSTIRQVISFVASHPEGKAFDQNLLHLVLANRAFERDDTARGLEHYNALQFESMVVSSNRYEYLERGFFRNMMNRLAMHMAAMGKDAEAIALIEKFDRVNDRVQGYFSIAERLYRLRADPHSFDYIDSGYSAAKAIDYAIPIDGAIDPRYFQIQLLSGIGGASLNKEAEELLRSLPEFGKIFGVYARVYGQTYEGTYYKAWSMIPSTLTESQDLQCRAQILLEASRARERAAGSQGGWKKMDEYIDWIWIYNDYYPN